MPAPIRPRMPRVGVLGFKSACDSFHFLTSYMDGLVVENFYQRSRFWSFIWKNPSYCPDVDLRDAVADKRIMYAVFQGQADKDYVFRGFICLYKAQRVSYVKKIINALSCQWYITLKPDAAEEACRVPDPAKTVDGPYSWGEWKPNRYGKKGFRTDLYNIGQAFSKGMFNVSDLAKDPDYSPLIDRYKKVLGISLPVGDFITGYTRELKIVHLEDMVVVRAKTRAHPYLASPSLRIREVYEGSPEGLEGKGEAPLLKTIWRMASDERLSEHTVL